MGVSVNLNWHVSISASTDAAAAAASAAATASQPLALLPASHVHHQLLRKCYCRPFTRTKTRTINQRQFVHCVNKQYWKKFGPTDGRKFANI